jgi:hypothetical protein
MSDPDAFDPSTDNLVQVVARKKPIKLFVRDFSDLFAAYGVIVL